MPMLTIALAALVTYVAPDGVFIDEGTAAGVAVGDVVRIGGETLQITHVAAESCRTVPPKNLFAIRAGAPVAFVKHGVATASKPPGARAPHPPKVAADQALWTTATPAWAEPRPTTVTQAEGPAAPAIQITGVLGLRGTLQTFDGLEGRATLYSRLTARGDANWYAHDVRGTYDGYDSRYAPPLLQINRMEVGHRAQRWDAQAGRMRLGLPLAAGSLDGAAFGLASVRLFAGLAPDPWKMMPTTDRPQVGVSANRAFTVGPLQGSADATALVSAWQGSLDRTALAPNLRLGNRRFQVTTRAEIDAYPTRTTPDQRSVETTRLYSAARVTLTDWLDTSARYDRYRAPYTLGMLEGDAPYTTETRQTGWADLRLRGGAWGTLRLSGGALDDPRGLAWVPGVDYSLPLLDWLDSSLSWFRHTGPTDTLDHARARLVARFDTPWPTELDLGGQLVDLRFLDRAENNETELTGLIGLWMATPGGFDVRLAAETTAARQPRTTAFGDIRWRFGR
jgi:hypothetical protein